MNFGIFTMVLGLVAHSTQAGGLVNGLIHPVFGPDHLLAMVAVGIISVQLGGKAIWKVPLAFVLFMLLGGIMSFVGVDIPMTVIETGITLSVIALGLSIAMNKHLGVEWTMAFVGFFAIFHGYAHGAEIPDLAEPALYAIGFVLSTAALHVTGVLIGEASRKINNGAEILRHIGSMIAGIGIAMLLGF